MFGEDQIAFHEALSRAHRHVEAFLGDFRRTLLSDGYAVHTAYAQRRRNCQRSFMDVEGSHRAGVAKALSLIGEP